VKIYAIKLASGYLEHCKFYATRNLALLGLYTMADKLRGEYGFKMDTNSFSYQSQELPDDDGGYVRLTSTYTIAEIDVME
jgi:hypothetical protein